MSTQEQGTWSSGMRRDRRAREFARSENPPCPTCERRMVVSK